MSEDVWSVDGVNKHYKHYRTSDNWHDLRAWMNEAYYKKGLSQYLDDNFLDQLRNHDFFARLWELELANWLHLTKIQMRPTRGRGPDFCLQLASGKKVWIEAVLATASTALNQRWREHLAKPRELGQLYDFPKDESTLRYASSLYTKAVKVKEKYLVKNIISEDDTVLIAVSGFPPGALHSDIELFLGAILPVGDQVVHFSTNDSPLDPSVRRSTHTNQLEYINTNGSPVLKQFLYPGTHFPFIDGVLFTEASNLQQLLGVWSSSFDESTNTPHIFPNYASAKSLDPELTDNFYFHEFIDNPPHITLETINPKIKLT